MFTKDKDKRSTLKLPLVITNFVVFIILIILYLAFEYFSLLGVKYSHVLTLCADLFGLIATSVLIGLLLSYTDIKEKNQAAVDEALNKWKNEANNVLETIELKLKSICNTYDYLDNIDLFPVDQLSNECVDKLMTRLSKKKLDSIKNLGEKYTQIATDCLQKFDRLQSGHLYHYYKRTIILEPINNQIKVKMLLEVCQTLPEVYTEEPKYYYIPRFRSKEEATSINVRAELNQQQILPVEKQLQESSDEYKMIFGYELISNKKNELILEIEYVYNNSNFYEAYYLADPTYEFRFECKVVGAENDEWEIKIVNYGYNNSKNKDVSISVGIKENSKTVSSEKDAWVSDGTTILSVFKKKGN